MGLVVETGTGDAAAESYASAADATTYHADRGNAAWATLPGPRQEQCLRLATEYLCQAYGASWQGVRAVATQALDWPRQLVRDARLPILATYGEGAFLPSGAYVPSTTVPTLIRDACSVLALKANAGPLAPDLTRGIKRQKIGPIETEFDDYSPQSKRYLAVDRMVAPYLISTNPYAARLERS